MSFAARRTHTGACLGCAWELVRVSLAPALAAPSQSALQQRHAPQSTPYRAVAGLTRGSCLDQIFPLAGGEPGPTTNNCRKQRECPQRGSVGWVTGRGDGLFACARVHSAAACAVGWLPWQRSTLLPWRVALGMLVCLLRQLLRLTHSVLARSAQLDLLPWPLHQRHASRSVFLQLRCSYRQTTNPCRRRGANRQTHRYQDRLLLPTPA